MTASDVLNFGKHGKLNNLHVKDDPEKFLVYLNLALRELHERFLLTTKEHIIDTVDGVTTYPFPSECYRIQEAYLENGDELGLNEDNVDGLGVYTPDAFTVQIPFAATGISVSFIYYSSPDPIVDLTDEVLVRPQMLKALLLYIAYEAYSSTSGASSPEAQAELALYEKACGELLERGLIQPENTSDDKFRDRGWC
jgi:hypothetical protein